MALRPIPFVVLALLAACRQDEASTEKPPPQTAPTQGRGAKDGFFVAEGAPEPRACESASDCVGDTIPDLGNPCCQNPRTLEPHARAYKRWIADWRQAHCADVSCPPPPSPSLPPKCAFVVECVEGRCADTCRG